MSAGMPRLQLKEMHKQEPFARVAPMLKTALLVSIRGGFLLASCVDSNACLIRTALALIWGANLTHNGPIPFLLIGSCIHLIFRSRLIKSQS